MEKDAANAWDSLGQSACCIIFEEQHEVFNIMLFARPLTPPSVPRRVVLNVWSSAWAWGQSLADLKLTLLHCNLDAKLPINPSGVQRPA